MVEFADRQSWEQEFDRFYDAELGKTFGNVMKALGSLSEFPRELLGRINSAKERRDYLAPRFFREHDLDFITKPGRTKMIAECEDSIDLFELLDRQLEDFLAPQRERFGITREWVDMHVAMMENEAQERSKTHD